MNRLVDGTGIGDSDAYAVRGELTRNAEQAAPHRPSPHGIRHPHPVGEGVGGTRHDVGPRRPQITGNALITVLYTAKVDSQNAIERFHVHRPNRCRRGTNTGIAAAPISTPPHCSPTVLTICRIAPRSETSAAPKSTTGSPAAALCAAPGSRSTITTAAPRRAKASAVPNPIPRAPPVTTATLPPNVEPRHPPIQPDSLHTNGRRAANHAGGRSLEARARRVEPSRRRSRWSRRQAAARTGLLLTPQTERAPRPLSPTPFATASTLPDLFLPVVVITVLGI